jgi:CRISP-associated protein Cas1
VAPFDPTDPLGPDEPPPADEPVPARMLNEYAYCPRLAYLEWVQHEWDDNAFTLDGEFVHRNTDQPDRRPLRNPDNNTNEPEENPDHFHRRSVRLESEQLGLVAVVDILEVEGNIATPIDYKRGRVPDIPEGAWEPERVQVCAQALLLREAGFECNEGMIWYAESRRRVTILFDDILVDRTLDLIEQCRKMARLGRLPLPLVDSPKCPRCSLVGICLPDETNLLRKLAAAPKPVADPIAPPGAQRRLLAPRPETAPLHITEPGARVSKKNDRLVVELKDQKLGEARLHEIDHVCLYGPIQITTQALHELFDREIPVCYLTGGGWFRGISHGLPHRNVELRIAQYAIAAEPAEAVKLARAFVAGKVRNGRTLLRRNLDDGPDTDRVLRELNDAADAAERAENIPTLMGIEGMAAKRYFAAFAQLLKPENGFVLRGRNRRPPTDPVNAVLSLFYSMLAREATVAALACGLDPYLGFLHAPRYGRPALALDLAEEFRAILADSTALTLFNTGELKAEHFVHRAGAVQLTVAGRRAAIGAWERRMSTEVQHPIFNYPMAYRRILAIQARVLSRTITREIPEYPAFRTR